jgi:hypothetical protein
MHRRDSTGYLVARKPGRLEESTMAIGNSHKKKQVKHKQPRPQTHVIQPGQMDQHSMTEDSSSKSLMVQGATGSHSLTRAAVVPKLHQGMRPTGEGLLLPSQK